MDIFGIVSFAAIAVICYGVGQIIKATPIKNDFIIPINIFVGGCLGALAFVLKIPEFPANDILTAIAVGIVSACVSTCINEIVKRFQKLKK
jgi:hypothetical protein